MWAPNTRVSFHVRKGCPPLRRCEALITGFWEAKIERDTRPNAPPPQSVIEFLHVFLKTKSGLKATVRIRGALTGIVFGACHYFSGGQ